MNAPDFIQNFLPRPARQIPTQRTQDAAGAHAVELKARVAALVVAGGKLALA